MARLQLVALFALGAAAAAANERRQDYAACRTIADIDLYSKCIFSDWYTIDTSSILSEINGLISGISESYSVTISSLPPPDQITVDPNNPVQTDFPKVSDIVSSYSEFSKTHSFSDSSAPGFTFDTSAWSSAVATSTSSSSTSLPTDLSTITPSPTRRSTISLTPQSRSTTPASSTSTDAASMQNTPTSTTWLTGLLSTLFLIFGLL